MALCRSCSSYLHDVVEAIHILPYGLPIVPPPEELKEKVLRVARNMEFERSRPQKMSVFELLHHWTLRLMPVATSMFFIFILVSYFVGLRDQARLREQWEATSRQIQAAATLLGEGSMQPSKYIAMEGNARFPRAWGHVTVYETKYGFVYVLALGGLPSAESGQWYKVWLESGEQFIPGGSFRPDESGFGSLTIQRPVHDVETIRITLEQSDHSEPVGREVLYTEL